MLLPKFPSTQPLLNRMQQPSSRHHESRPVEGHSHEQTEATLCHCEETIEDKKIKVKFGPSFHLGTHEQLRMKNFSVPLGILPEDQQYIDAIRKLKKNLILDNIPQDDFNKLLID